MPMTGTEVCSHLLKPLESSLSAFHATTHLLLPGSQGVNAIIIPTSKRWKLSPGDVPKSHGKEVEVPGLEPEWSVSDR